MARAGNVIIKPDSAQNKQTTFTAKKNWQETWKAWEIPRNHQLTLIKVLSKLKNERVRKFQFV